MRKEFVQLKVVPFGREPFAIRRQKVEAALERSAADWLVRENLTEVAGTRRIDRVEPDNRYGRDPSVTIYLEAESS